MKQQRIHYYLNQADSYSDNLVPRLGESFNGWLQQGRAQESNLVFPNIYYRGVSENEYRSAKDYGEFSPFFSGGNDAAILVERNPAHFMSQGVKNVDYIVQLDTSGLDKKFLALRYKKGRGEQGFERMPFRRAIRVWKWNSIKNQHILIKSPETAA